MKTALVTFLGERTGKNVSKKVLKNASYGPMLYKRKKSSVVSKTNKAMKRKEVTYENKWS